MTVVELLNTIVERGGRVLLENGHQLRVKPSNVLTDEMRAEIRARKAEIVAFLARRNTRPFTAPIEVTRAALERGQPITTFGWPRDYCPSDYAQELAAAPESAPPPGFRFAKLPEAESL